MIKKHSLKKLMVALMAFLMLGAFAGGGVAWADEESGGDGAEEAAKVSGTNIGLMPVSKVLQISSESSYEDKITITNDGNEEIEVEVYAAPYSYVYSEEDGIYRLGFNKENNFTQIVRWITVKNDKGEWVKTANFKVPAHESKDVSYKITTPKDIPAGGQYAVIFAHTLNGVVSSTGIRTEASPGMVIYGRSDEGEVKIVPGISDMKIGYDVRNIGENNTPKSVFYASAKVKNDGNVDFSAVGKLTVEGIIGFGSYETPATKGRISVIPESELEVSDDWEDSPAFGLYKATWTVTAGDAKETIETIIFVNPLPLIIISIIVLTIVAVWVTIVIRKRKERSSRLAV